MKQIEGSIYKELVNSPTKKKHHPVIDTNRVYFSPPFT